MKKALIPGSGIITALLSSVCCITPVLAMIAGASGWAAAFSWLEPFRPYLMGVTILVLGIAWYGRLRPQKEIACNCVTKPKQAFMQTKTFLTFITVFALTMLAFPYYAHIFYSPKAKQVIVVDKINIQTTRFSISGMSCNGCEAHVAHEINKLNGVISSSVSYKAGSATVKFDNSKAGVGDIEKAVIRAGYKVTEKNEN